MLHATACTRPHRSLNGQSVCCCSVSTLAQVLGVRRSATQREITQAFRRLSREWHPDKNPAPEATAKFQAISQGGCAGP
jgi:DnaJ-domain-containing protein 1